MLKLLPALLQPAAYPHPVRAIELIETHISWVILTGDYAYKIKKPVAFDFVDFSTLAKRQFYCQEELRLNRRYAPDLYIDVVAITASAAQIQVNGLGQVIDYAVKMHQFSTQQSVKFLVEQGQLSAALLTQFAQTVASFHRQICIAPADSAYGDAAVIHQAFQENFSHIRPHLNQAAGLAQLARLEAWGTQHAEFFAVLMRRRKAQGGIRECHGDLHLGNLVMQAGRILPFDGLEFNPTLRWIDVSSDVAFLMMDLLRHGCHEAAYQFLNTYLSETGDYAALSVFRYYLVYRALVRAKVALLKQPADWGHYHAYADVAETFIAPHSVKLLITHGYSGAGKSTTAAHLARQHGLIHLRSDVERQRLFQTSSAHETAFVAQNSYTAEKTAQTYQTLADHAEISLKAGFSVIVDATFLQTAQRQLFRALAQRLAVPLLILTFQVAESELQRRIVQRQQQGEDASEATLAVLHQQLETAQAFTEAEQAHLVPVTDNIANVLKSL